MTVLIVAYDLKKETKRPDIVAEVQKTDWACLSESSYAIETDETVSGVMARFKEYIDDNDQLYVVTLTDPWTGWGPKELNDWLVRRLGSAE
jgi:CRISPR/Cas system-associated endoribonuclease Cas2